MLFPVPFVHKDIWSLTFEYNKKLAFWNLNFGTKKLNYIYIIYHKKPQFIENQFTKQMEYSKKYPLKENITKLALIYIFFGQTQRRESIINGKPLTNIDHINWPHVPLFKLETTDLIFLIISIYNIVYLISVN